MASSYEEYYFHNFIVICAGFGRFERGWDENRSIFTSSRRGLTSILELPLKTRSTSHNYISLLKMI